ncbi:hypothetical protein DBV23_04375 [Edwardsiella ictaluri]|uniref:Putative sugar isomerase n=1 Tax=Edwardsiella ictaluri (strain 93-146) TaxID=634503 RepID=C5B9J5_EDWI9|nr:putative sugar isomerase [Edwardsiella ictaluri 93-146]ARD40425.1 hypothetical protein B6E78_14500 [Edwardsiella ictaluri]AVZ81587.1 hypothetical protein DBV23_04375 [Edwardsiella ictaluri]EKS7762079.1 hypothetical protein [Edwardsiella ictaluri]EKS7768889.1 hypothetical protein [Edwardsiella ictaluri]
MSDEVLGYSPAWIQARGVWHTAREIAQQPVLWRMLQRELREAQSRWHSFLQTIPAPPALRSAKRRWHGALACDLDDLWLMFPFLQYLQTLALETSLALGITPDNPYPSREVNRVVQGVVIDEYPVTHSTIATMEV